MLALALASPALTWVACADVSVNQDGVAPLLISVEPAQGPSEGGSLVVLSGRDFDENAIVRFGGELAPQVTWVDAQTLNAVTPKGAGKVSVSVENPNQKTSTLEAAFTYTGAGTGCAIVATKPTIGGADVPITGELRLTYSTPLNVGSLEGAIHLRLLGEDPDSGEEVPIEVALDATTDEVILQPKKSLRYWASYSVTTDDSVLSAAGETCAPLGLAFHTIEPSVFPRPLHAAPVSGLTVVNSRVIAASEGYRGLQTYDVADLAAAKVASDVPTAFGPRNIVAKNNRAYVPSGFEGVQIFDVTDPLTPKLLGHGGTPGRALDVAILEKDGKTFLVVADFDGGARVLDVTDPAAVIDIGPLELGGGKRSVTAVDAQGSRVALAEGTRIFLLELPDPADLSKQITHKVLDVSAGVSDVLLDGDFLYLGKSAFGIASYKIADPTAPVFADEADDPDGPCPSACVGYAARIVKDGGDLFVAFARNGVQRYTVDAQGIMTNATHYKVFGDVRSLAVTADRVYAGGEEGLVIFDRAGDGATPLWLDQAAHGRARNVRVSGDVAYVSAFLSGLQTFSLTQPDAPALIDRDDTPASLTADEASAGVSSEGNILAVADGRAGVALFDTASPQNPVLGGVLDTSDAVRVVLSSGGLVYACNDNAGLVIVDATDVATPTLLGEAKLDDVSGSDACRDLALADTILYVGRTRGLGVLDVTDPKAPAWKNLIALPSKDAIVGVRKVGAHLLATSSRFDYEGFENNATRLHVFDLADPLTPKLIWSSEELGRAAGLAIAGDIAFVAAGSAGVQVFDISDVTLPVHEGTIATPGNATALAQGLDILYVAQGAGGLQAIRTGPLPK